MTGFEVFAFIVVPVLMVLLIAWGLCEHRDEHCPFDQERD